MEDHYNHKMFNPMQITIRPVNQKSNASKVTINCVIITEVDIN